MTAEELHQLVFGKPQWLTDMEEDHRPPVLKKQSVITREWLPTFLATGVINPGATINVTAPYDFYKNWAANANESFSKSERLKMQ